ncbi:MipA/OmpV family protein [Aliidiomarina sp.]|uniref:MipA/OmpV family protein n=1 Tax=Aliidiomarina sp. TaxID=1872439 RepID=UPI003A4E47CC
MNYLLAKQLHAMHKKNSASSYNMVITLALCLLCASQVLFNKAMARDAEQQAPGGPPMGLSAGVAVLSSNPSYVGLKSDTIAVPVIGYEGERYYFRGLSVGRHITKTRAEQLSLSVNIEPFRFRPKESSNPAMQQLDKREFGASVGVNYQYNTRFGSISADINTEITKRHNGQRANISYSLPLNRPGQRWQLAPEIRLNYTSKDYIRYYFGVSAEESLRSGLPSYSGGHAFSPAIGLGGYYAFTDKLSAVGNLRLTRSASAITDSPMIKGRSARSLFVAISYQF